MARKWVKLWCNFDDDNLTLEEIGAWYTLVKLAGISPVEGCVCINSFMPYSWTQLKTFLRCSIPTAKKLIATLVDKERILILPSGILKLKNWEKYQSEYDRVKDYPSRKGTPKGTPIEVEVEVEPRVKNLEVEVEEKPPPAAAPLSEKEKAFFAVYEKYLGTVPSIMVPQLKLAANIYPLDWVQDAFITMYERKIDRPCWRYVSRILEDWGANGRPTDKSTGDSSEDPKEFVRRYDHLLKKGESHAKV